MIIVFFYINDIIILNRKKNKTIIKEFKADLYQRYKLKDKKELKWFLKLKIIRNREAQKI
jgi:hypothetical protein